MRARTLPPVVVIQERHANHGENFKLFKIENSKSRRQYVARFLSSEKHIFRYRSMQVAIGQKVKETTYKGSPLAVSRLLLLEGLENPFPRPNRSYNSECATQEADSASSSAILNPPLSFFNLSDAKTTACTPDGNHSGSGSETKTKPIDWVSISGKAKDTVLDVTCHPKRLIDFNLLFGSVSVDNEESEACEDDLPVLIIDGIEDGQAVKNAEDEKKDQKPIHNEKQVKQITSSSQRVQVNLPPPQIQMGPPPTVPSEPLPRPARAIEGPNRVLRPRIFPTVPYRPTIMPNFADPMMSNWMECPCYHQGAGVPFFSVPAMQRNFPESIRNIFYNDWRLVPVSVPTEMHNGNSDIYHPPESPSSLHGGEETR